MIDIKITGADELVQKFFDLSRKVRGPIAEKAIAAANAVLVPAVRSNVAGMAHDTGALEQSIESVIRKKTKTKKRPFGMIGPAWTEAGNGTKSPARYAHLSNNGTRRRDTGATARPNTHYKYVKNKALQKSAKDSMFRGSVLARRWLEKAAESHGQQAMDAMVQVMKSEIEAIQ